MFLTTSPHDYGKLCQTKEFYFKLSYYYNCSLNSYYRIPVCIKCSFKRVFFYLEWSMIPKEKYTQLHIAEPTKKARKHKQN